MGILKDLFGSLINPEPYKGLIVNEITSTEELDSFLNSTADTPALLFKHSTTCPVSSRANARLSDYVEAAGDDVPPISLVKVIESRPVSNAIAERLHVTHQSPQIILVSDGKAAWNASHHNITANNIVAALGNL
jgi:monothiol bacilliredoxin